MKITRVLILVSTIMFLAGFSAATGIQNVEIVDKVDRDGDGKLSSFKVEITADLKIDEKGADYGDGVVGALPTDGTGPGVANRLAETTGEPKFHVKLGNQAGYQRAAMWKNPPAEKNSDSTSFKVEYDYSDVETLMQRNKGTNWVKDIEKLANGEREVTGLEIHYYEGDSCNTCQDFRDIEIDNQKVVFKEENNIRLEKPSKDEEKQVSISANTEATLYINGEEKGETPWTGDLPVDMTEEELADIRLEKDGYVTKTVKDTISPPESKNYQLEKVKKPLVVDSDPQGATVRVNGQKIGETPVSKKYWVKKDLDIRVEGENKTESFSNVNTPWDRKVDLSTTDSSTGSYSGGLYNYDLTVEPNYYDDLITDIDLTGLTVAKFNRSSKSGSTSDKLSFDASGSYSISYNISSYSWDFGDGTTAKGEKAEHSYSSPGNYTVNLTIENTNGTKRFQTKEIWIKNLKPKPDFVMNKKKIETGKPVTFRAGPSKDPDGSVTSYQWNLGDGSTVRGSQVNHVYKSAGDYMVELEITDNYGATKKTTRTIRVVKPNVKPSASFTPSKKTVKTGEKIQFDASASNDQDGSINTYSWNLGDGFSKTGQKISYNYSAAGEYTVELNVIDSGGLKASTKQKITVKSSNESDQSNSNADETSTEDSTEDQKEKDSEKSENSSDGNDSDNSNQEENNGIGSMLIDLIQSLF